MSVAQWFKPQSLLHIPRHKIRGKQLISTCFFAIGSSLLAYVGGSYAWMYHRQHALMKQWQEQNEVAQSLTTNDIGLTRLAIPAIHLDVVLAEGTSARSLALGPGHLTNTAVPGDAGNAVIAAHRDTFFRHIADLKVGDDIYVQRNGRRYHYVVSGRKIVSPEDLSVLSSSTESRITLITCYPTHFVGPAPKRLIVIAKLVRSV